MATRTTRICLVAALCLGLTGITPGQASASDDVIGYEISIAETEAGRLRFLAQRLAKQNVLYQLHLGGVRKSDLTETVARIDRVIETLEYGSPGYAVPAPWTNELRDQVRKVDAAWGPLRQIALASQYDYLKVSRQFAGADSGSKDPLVIRYFDNLATDLVNESEKLMGLYDAACQTSGASPELCVTSTISGYSAMLSEKATKHAIYIVAGIDVAENRKALEQTMDGYLRTRKAVQESPFFAKALSPERGQTGEQARGLLGSLQSDWNAMQKEFEILNAGDEKNFDLDRLLERQNRMISRIERFTAAMVRYANIAYGN